MATTDWLPELMLFSDYGEDWGVYEEALYKVFKRDFVDDHPAYGEEPVRTKYHPSFNDREWTFRHLTTEGPVETERVRDIQRCERVPWPRPIVENCDDGDLLIWENTRRRGERRVCIWLVAEDYLLVLARRTGYLLLWTAYTRLSKHRREALKAEYDDYCASHNKKS